MDRWTCEANEEKQLEITEHLHASGMGGREGEVDIWSEKAKGIFYSRNLLLADEKGNIKFEVNKYNL
jgi:hypothetical protein